MTFFPNLSNSILKYFSSIDSTGENIHEIDTKKEYDLLGKFLCGNKIEGIETSFEDLTESDRLDIQKAYVKLANSFASDTDRNNTIKVNDENIEEIVSLYKKIESGESALPKDFQAQALTRLNLSITNYLKENGVAKADIIEWQLLIDDIIKPNNGLEINRELIEYGKKSLRLIEEPYDNNKLREQVENYISENNIQNLLDNTYIDLGDGKFNKVATQQTELCWAHAGINSLLQTSVGTKILQDNRYYDEKTGVFAIHLQEAEDNGFHDGIYIITPEEIQGRGQELSSGEGDITAYMLAIEKYFEEVQANPTLEQTMYENNHPAFDTNVGNFSFRFFELLTGGKHKNCTEINFSGFFTTVQNGINFTPHTTGSEGSLRYKDAIKFINEKRGAMTLAIGEHCVSVVGVKDGNLIIQESTNSQEDFKNYVTLDSTEPINGAPAYILPESVYYSDAVKNPSYFMWKQ